MAARVLDLCPLPRIIVWDITYACPLRCSHCYSESGRRPSRQLSTPELFRVTDALIAGQPATIVFSGGEPLLVGDLFAVAERMRAAGIHLVLYTGGWFLPSRSVMPIVTLFSRVTVSVDGATPDTHDRIRGRPGSFDRAMKALSRLNEAIDERLRSGHSAPALGIDYVVLRSNFQDMERLCTEVLPRFNRVGSASFGAVIPTGLASRPSFEAHELLSDEQAALLGSQEFSSRLQSLAPPWIDVSTTDNRRFQMHPAFLASSGIPPLQIEPDGAVRAMPIYEGTVGSLLKEPLSTLWARAIERWTDPRVVGALTSGLSVSAWAAATRQIDLEFGTQLDRERIMRRPVYAP